MSHPGGPPHFARLLGVRDIAFFMVTSGSSVQWAGVAATAGTSSLTVWLIGALLMFVPLSVCVVFLSSRYPDEGGLYVWTKRAFGPYAGFMTGWLYWVGTPPFLSGLLYFAAGSLLYVTGHRDALTSASPAYFIGVSMGVLAVATGANFVGAAVIRWLGGAGTVTRWLQTGLLVLLGALIWSRHGSAHALSLPALVPGTGPRDLAFWATVAFAWTGVEAASLMGGEIREPRRTIPLAIAIAAPMIFGVYLLSTLSVLVSLPPGTVEPLYSIMDTISIDTARLGLGWLLPVAVLCVVIDRLATVGAWIAASARIPLVAGLDHYLPAAFGRVDRRTGTPVVAIATAAVVIAIFVVLGQAGTTVAGAYHALMDMMIVATLLPWWLIFSAAIRLSAGHPVPGEARIPGGRATVIAMAAVGLLTSIAATGLSFLPPQDDPHPGVSVLKVVAMTAVLLGIGTLIFVTGRRRARRSLR